MKNSFILFCAGEDSGDNLGEDFVYAILDKSVEAWGIGGPKMKRAGLKDICDYNTLPVSGFLDVLPKLKVLHQNFKQLKNLLYNDLCIGLIAIDYPGFNIKLCNLAKKLNKKVLYIAPPQIWAWNAQRAQKLKGIPLAVLFDFEAKIYKAKGADVEILKHPFLKKEKYVQDISKTDKEILLLLPGSRKSQLYRNLPFYLEVAYRWYNSTSKKCKNREVKLVVSRKSLFKDVEIQVQRYLKEKNNINLSLKIAPIDSSERRDFFSNGSVALCTPGTATLELALSGTPLVVASKIDFWTYIVARLFVKTAFYSMPNILENKLNVSEFLGISIEKKIPRITKLLENVNKKSSEKLAISLKEKLKEGCSPEYFIKKIFCKS